MTTTTNRNEFTVLVTGSGPYPDLNGHQFSAEHNSAHQITKRLPNSIPIGHPLNPTALPIRIINDTAADGQYVCTEYGFIRPYIKKLWDDYESKVDLFLHLGMAGREPFCVERSAFNERYTCGWYSMFEEATKGFYMRLDDKGRTIKDLTEKEGKGMWDDPPMGLRTSIDVDAAVQGVMNVINQPENPSTTSLSEESMSGETSDGLPKQKVDVVAHYDASSYCCGFTYYESMANCWKRKSNKKVLFLHVTSKTDAVSVGRGADVVCAVAGAVCQQIAQGTISPDDLLD